jgi:hypothetical protein
MIGCCGTLLLCHLDLDYRLGLSREDAYSIRRSEMWDRLSPRKHKGWGRETCLG